MLNKILSNPENLFWFLPIVFISMLVLYRIAHSIVEQSLQENQEEVRETLSEAYKLKPEDVSDSFVQTAIEETAIYYGNATLIVFAVIFIALILFGF